MFDEDAVTEEDNWGDEYEVSVGDISIISGELDTATSGLSWFDE